MNYYPNNPGNQNSGMPMHRNQGIPSPDGTINTPPETDMNTEAFQGSMQQILSENIGAYVVVEFLIGTQNMTLREGYIYNVGRSFLVLYNHDNQEYIVCDVFSVKFVTFPVPAELQQRGPSKTSSFPSSRAPETRQLRAAPARPWTVLRPPSPPMSIPRASISTPADNPPGKKEKGRA